MSDQCVNCSKEVLGLLPLDCLKPGIRVLREDWTGKCDNEGRGFGGLDFSENTSDGVAICGRKAEARRRVWWRGKQQKMRRLYDCHLQKCLRLTANEIRESILLC